MTTPSPAAMPPQTSVGTGGTPAAGTPEQSAPGGGQAPGTPNEPLITQSHMNHLLAEQKREFLNKYGDYDDVKQKAETFDSLVNTAKTAEEQAAELNAKLATTERDKADLAAQNLRYKLAGQAQVPADLWDMVGGVDEASIKTNIEKLKQHITPAAGTPDAGGQQPQQQQPRRPAPVSGQGQAGNGGTGGATGNGIAGGRDLFNSRHNSQGVKADA